MTHYSFQPGGSKCGTAVGLSVPSRCEYSKAMLQHYQHAATRSEHSRLLGNLVEVAGYGRSTSSHC